MGGGHFDALEMLLRLRTTHLVRTSTKSRHPPTIVSSKRQVEMPYLGFRLIPSLARIATGCCECCRGLTDLKSLELLLFFQCFRVSEVFGR